MRALVIFVLLYGLALVSGNPGKAGPAGPARPTGPAGPTGPTGPGGTGTMVRRPFGGMGNMGMFAMTSGNDIFYDMWLCSRLGWWLCMASGIYN